MQDDFSPPQIWYLKTQGRNKFAYEAQNWNKPCRTRPPEPNGGLQCQILIFRRKHTAWSGIRGQL